jgi:chromosome partitioning protein
MKIISVINQKGGVGKTTLTANLGTALATLGKKVLLLDLDPQANLSYSFGIKTDGGNMADVLQGKKTLSAILTQAEGVNIAPSSLLLADMEVSLVNKIGRERMLKERLGDVKGFDYVLIDCPPSLSVLTVNALNASHEVLIPLQMEVLSMQGLTQLLDTIHEVKQVLNKGLKVRGIVPSMFDGRRKLSEEVLHAITGKIKEHVFKTHIRECVKIAEAPSFGKSVTAYAPSSNGAEDFRHLAREFIKTEE